MTLASINTIAQALQAFKPNSTCCRQLSPRLILLSRLFFKVFNSSTSCQTSSNICEDLGEKVHQEGLSSSEDLGGRVQKIGVPLKFVVATCTERWFKEYLKAAEDGNPETQTTVGQMLCSGYGVQKDAIKGHDWINRARWKRKTLRLTKGPSDKSKLPGDAYYFI